MSSYLMKTTRAMAMAALIAGSVLTLHVARAQQAPPAGIKRTDLQRHDLSVPGREAVQVRVEPPVTLKAGDVLFIPAGTIHAAKNVGSSTASELHLRRREGKAAAHIGEVTELLLATANAL